MATPLKEVYTKSYLSEVANSCQTQCDTFPTTRLLKLVFDREWPQRELKDRIYHIARCLVDCFDGNYAQALKVLKPVAVHFNGYEAMFFPAVVELFGQHDWKRSLPALAHFTPYASSEFAVRPFIKQDSARMMAQMTKWATHRNHHVRRLASEGCRPRLPWAMSLPAFKKDPQAILPILELLKQDPSLYVRKSVANNLNDIGKDHPALLLQIAKRWLGQDQDTDWIVKHACRSLLKAGDVQALQLFGYANPDTFQVNNLHITPQQIAIGDAATFTCCVQGPAQTPVRLEYAIDFVKKRGAHSRKVFKISEAAMSDTDKFVERKHSFEQRTTRTHYAGEHHLHIIVNGVIKASQSFYLS